MVGEVISLSDINVDSCWVEIERLAIVLPQTWEHCSTTQGSPVPLGCCEVL